MIGKEKISYTQLQRLTRKKIIDIENDIDKKDRISLIHLTPQADTVADVVIKKEFI